LCSHDFYVILYNGYGQLFTNTLNDYVVVHLGRAADRGRRREWVLETDNGTEKEFWNTIGERDWQAESGKGVGEGEQRTGLRNSEFVQ